MNNDTQAAAPITIPSLTRADFDNEREVRWCPGCGDYAILATLQKTLPLCGVAPENTVFISGIGCSSRLPYYLNTYGFHTIHGRAPTIATGLKIVRPELSVWVITGDGDGFSIGTNHLMHLFRRNVDLTVLLLNNRVYGLTKGQVSPTSVPEQITKTTPHGALDAPLNPLALALSAGCSFMARVIDTDAGGLQQVLLAAHKHRGTALIEIYQNCPVFNDGAFDEWRDKQKRQAHTVFYSEPLQDKTQAFALCQQQSPLPTGLLYQEIRPVFEEQLSAQEETLRVKKGAPNLKALLEAGGTWTTG